MGQDEEDGVTLVLLNQNDDETAQSHLGGIIGQLMAKIGLRTIVFKANDKLPEEEAAAEASDGTVVSIEHTEDGLSIEVIKPATSPVANLT